MFEGVAEQAMNWYVLLIKNSRLVNVERYGAGETGSEGTIKRADFVLGGQTFICIDSPVKHGFTFTPSISIYVDCEDAAEIEYLFGELSAGGAVLMPLDNYGFSTRFGWVQDRFGVSWQLNLT